jgi:hypothetical protein
MIVETPVTVVSHQTQVTGTMPAGTPVLIAKGAPTAAPSAGGNTTTASNQLPKTVSNVPLLGMSDCYHCPLRLGAGSCVGFKGRWYPVFSYSHC